MKWNQEPSSNSINSPLLYDVFNENGRVTSCSFHKDQAPIKHKVPSDTCAKSKKKKTGGEHQRERECQRQRDRWLEEKDGEKVSIWKRFKYWIWKFPLRRMHYPQSIK